MKTRLLAVLLFASVVANIVLLVALSLIWQTARPMEVQVVRPAPVTNILRPIRTNLVVQVRPLRWSDLESTNYDRYIANLRGIGCPEETIRDIIVAEVDEIFAERRAREVVTPQQQWWRAKPDPEVAQRAKQALAALNQERHALLTRLLGPDWEASSTETLFAPNDRPLDGPILGALSPEARRRVREIERQAARIELATSPQSGHNLPPSPISPENAELFLRRALAEVLTPEQLEEYLLRYSHTAETLRRQTAELALGPEQFRALFRTADTYDQQLAALARHASPDAEQKRAELLVQREAAVLNALPPEERELYTVSQTPEYRAARQTVEELGLPAERAVPLSQIQRLVTEERQRILNDPALDETEQAARLQAVEAQRLAALEKLLGPDAFRRYQDRLAGGL
jgi:hypothetical protein